VLVMMLIAAGLPIAHAQDEDNTPETTVDAFYTWYLDLMTPDESGEWETPLLGAYRESDALTDDFIVQVDDLLESFEGGGYDPFLCAQNVPGAFSTSDAMYDGDDAAQVTVWMDFMNYHAFTVELVNEDNAWLINDVVCDADRTPEGVVQSFYTWYLRYTAGDGEGERRNPMVDGAYQYHTLLSDDFIAQVTDLIASFKGGGYDPFLCAQDVPSEIEVGEAQIEDDLASLNVATSFPNHEFAVELEQIDGEWMISDIVCAK
jgi:hypothetical protein